jgi:hypothetical protein
MKILNNYLKLKMHYKDDSKGAATASKELHNFQNVKSDKIEAKFKKRVR